ncbi:sterol desaturase family protein [Dyella sp. A6]|uniref:sterol desaturase family protein n=1 Tax=Dyella aluminiiresistens TaxID=3069105 RepID=UPI002E78F42E|nr:sterol desaturase family protein [Dyella sp. A6]
MLTPERIMAWAIPGFFVLIAIEFAVARWRGRPQAYRANDAINSLGLGMLSQIVGVFTRLFNVGVYAWFAEHLAPWSLPADRVWVWISGLLLYDFLYYWLHRGGHRVALLWAAHVVHHQSERYNLTTALRQTGTGFLLGWVFYLPMALLGYPVAVFAVIALIDLLYQFWVHTEQIGRLGWFDRVFCSPSNHRAHHAVNERYLDRNYGGILIVWDRLFGSFVEESDSDPPVYGTRSPLRSWNPLWANVEVYWTLWRSARHARRWRDRLQVWLRPPGWRPADAHGDTTVPRFDIDHAPFDPPISRALRAYCLIQFGLLLLMGMHFLRVATRLGGVEAAGYALWLVAGLCTIGLLLERRRGAAWLEVLRVLGMAVIPLACGRWFGVTHLDIRLGLAMLVVFGASALALPWMHAHDDGHGPRSDRVTTG